LSGVASRATFVSGTVIPATACPLLDINDSSRPLTARRNDTPRRLLPTIAHAAGPVSPAGGHFPYRPAGSSVAPLAFVGSGRRGREAGAGVHRHAGGRGRGDRLAVGQEVPRVLEQDHPVAQHGPPFLRRRYQS